MVKNKEKTKNKTKDKKMNKLKFSDFIPLIIAFLIVIGTTAMFAFSKGNFKIPYIMRIYMSNFFIVFSIAKFGDFKGFVEAFKKYDLISMKYPQYAVLYPMIELFLGVMYARNQLSLFVNFVTFTIMSVGAFSIYKVRKEKGAIECACLGTLFNIPLTSVTLFENISMAVMAAYNLYTIFM